MKRAHLYILSGVLTGLALAVFLYKYFVFGFPLLPEARTEIWRVEVRLQFEAREGPAKATMFIPARTEPLIVVDQSFVSPGYGVTTEPRRGEGLRAAYSIRSATGSQTLYYRAVIQPARVIDQDSRDNPPKAEPPDLEGPKLAAAHAIVDAAKRQSSDASTLAALILKQLKTARPEGEASFLLGPQPSNRRLVVVAVDLLEFAGVPARVVNGMALTPERRNARFTHWLEYYADYRWHALHTAEAPAQESGRQTLLPWWRGRAPFFEVTGGSNPLYTITITRSQEFALRTALAHQRQLEKKLVEYSLFGLPLQAQSLFRTVLVVPMGILLLVVLRNVVGIKTFGTFMPVLIALAFRQTGLLWGCVFVAVVVGLGLAVRFYLERLKLLLVPRLAAVVIVVILLLAILTVLSFKLGFERGLSIGLFPIVILTMTIERMTVVWEERGAAEAFQQAAGSIAVGALCYVVMNVALVEHLFFVFPELLLVVLAGTLLLGRYSGYRLTELRRFRVLAR